VNISQDTHNELALTATIADIQKLIEYLESGMTFVASEQVIETSHHCFNIISDNRKITACALAIAEIGRIGDPIKALIDFKREYNEICKECDSEEAVIGMFSRRLGIEISFARSIYRYHRDRHSAADIIAILMSVALGFSTPLTRTA
jgi:hypothetical protein